jgi:hypothetical protein
MRQSRTVALKIVLFMLLLGSAADAGAQCSGCPGGACCGFIDCGQCNSGSFCARCVAFAVPGVAGCGATNGSCALGRCATCVQSFNDMDCVSHARCGGMVCAPDGCFAGMSAAAMAAEPCTDCETVAVTNDVTDAEVPIEALLSRTTPVKVLAAEATAPQRPGRYRIRNDGQSALVTLISVVTFVDKAGRRASFSEMTDAWTRGRGFLAPGEEKELPLMTEVTNPLGLARVVVRPVYAEFEDGTHVGVKARQRRQCLRLHRQATAEMMRHVLAAYRTGGDQALRQTLAKSEIELAWLRRVLDERGVPAVVEELGREGQLSQ